MRAIEMRSQHKWLIDTEIVRDRARPHKRSDDEPAVLEAMDYELAARDVVCQAAKQATHDPNEALALIGEAPLTKNAPLSVRYAAAAGYRKGANTSGKHWAQTYGKHVKRRIAEELYELIRNHRVEEGPEEASRPMR